MSYKKFLNLAIVLFVCGLSACKKDGFGPLTDSRPEVPVTIANVFDYRPAPTVKASKAENKITITLQIPSSSGRTIKEVTKMAASTTANFTAINSGTAVGTAIGSLWSITPVAVNATSYTFTTTFDEYRVKTATAASTVIASNALLPRDFYFLLTLDNNQTVIPQNIRVWVTD